LSDTGDVRREEVDAVTVEVAARPVVMLSGAWVGVPGQDLRVAQRNAGVQGIGDRGVTQRVRADVSRDLCHRRDSDHHPVGVATVDGISRVRPKHQRSRRPIAAARLESPEYRDGDRHGRWLVAFADQMKHPVPAQGFAVVLDPYGRSLRRA
jgi:hypothetical protein